LDRGDWDWFPHYDTNHPDLDALILGRIRLAAAVCAVLALYVEWLSLPRAIRTPGGAEGWIGLAAAAVCTGLIMGLNRGRIAERLAQPIGVAFTLALQLMLAASCGADARALHGGHSLDPAWGVLAAGWLTLSRPWLAATLASGLGLCLLTYTQSWDGGLVGAPMAIAGTAALMAVRVRRDTLKLADRLRDSQHRAAADRAALEETQKLVQRRIDELELVYRSAPVGLAALDANLGVIRLNQKLAELVDNPHARPGEHLSAVAPMVAEALEGVCRKVLQSGSPLVDIELQTLCDGSRRYWQASCFPLRLEDVDGVSLVLQDITERKLFHQEVLASKERYELAAQGANDGLWDWDLRRETIHFSARWKSMLGYLEHEIGDRPGDWLNRAHPEDLPMLRNRFWEHIQGLTPHFESEHRMRHRDGSYRWVLSRGVVVRDDSGDPYRMAGSQTDISDRKRYEQQLVHDAAHDVLTGLPNRMMLAERLERCLARAAREPGYRFAVLFLDLDRFKLINDSLGHGAGDALLVEVGRRLRRAVRAEDMVARIGGDEFTILLEGLADERAAIGAAERIQQALAEPVRLQGREVRAVGSVGIAFSDGARRSAEEVLRDADAAMYRAKSQGGGRCAPFHEDLDPSAVPAVDLETDLRGALRRGELELWYQPILAISDDRLLGFEALLHWRRPQEGLIPPSRILPLAERCGLIQELGAWALGKSCEQMAEWRRQGLDDTLMAVNVSSLQLREPDFYYRVSGMLDRWGLRPELLELELTESALIDIPDGGLETLRALARLGVRAALDDFGAGYRSLTCLHRLPLSSLKISEQFVQGAPRRESVGLMAGAMIELAPWATSPAPPAKTVIT
jgi:diguanylate cyclase (GGDEF)-like protein/PAS domain S-box-containing protein